MLTEHDRVVRNRQKMTIENCCRVLLINPRISGESRYGKFKEVGSYLPPYGLLSIAAVLEKSGHAVKVSDADSRKGLTLNDLRAIIDEFNPHVIGLTAYSIGRMQLIETAGYIKTFSSAKVVVGGPHVMTFPDDLTKYDCFDLFVTGEGEYIMLDIVQYCQGKKELKEIEGVIYKDNNGQVIKNNPRPFIQDLDNLPYPAFHLLDNLHDYKPMQLLYKRLPVLTLISGRGCPFSCIFCNSIWGRKVRINSAEYIMGLVKKMVNEFGIREIMFYEDTFCINRDRIDKLCDMLIEESINVTWSCSSNVKTLDKPLLAKMKKAGCWLISMGLESGNNKVLEFIQKPVTIESVRTVCTWAEEVGLKIRGFFMLGHPIDTKETIDQTIEFAKSLPLFTINFCILQLLPGSRVREIAHNYGEVDYDLSLGTGHPGDALSFVPRGLTGEYLKKMQRKGYREFFIRPVQIWRLLKSVNSWEDINKYYKLFVSFVKLYI